MKRYDLCAITYTLALRKRGLPESMAGVAGVAIATAIAILKNSKKTNGNGSKRIPFSTKPSAPANLDANNLPTESVDNFLVVFPSSTEALVYLRGSQNPIASETLRKWETVISRAQTSPLYHRAVEMVAEELGRQKRVFDAYRVVRDALQL